MNKQFLLFILSLFVATTTFAQLSDSKKKKLNVSTSNGVEGSILQFANFTSLGKKITTIPRYSLYFNMNTDVNFEVSKKFIPFTGVSLKNIGLIAKFNDSVKYKLRVYTLGIPVGVKLNFTKKFGIKLGAEANLAFNYKEKFFLNGVKTTKFNEFFSDYNNLFYPSVFIGMHYGGLHVTYNYYPNNFFNDAKFSTYKAMLSTVSFGIKYDKKMLQKLMAKKKK